MQRSSASPPRTTRVCLALAALTFGLASSAHALPDLVPDIPSLSVDYDATVDPDDVLEGCAGGETNRLLIRYGLRTSNVSADDLEIGNPACPNCAENPGITCGNPLFECSTAHGHAHFEQYVRAELIDADDNVVAIGHKQGFCLLDTECETPVYTCGYQGISAGCADTYSEGLPCQYIDITNLGIPAGAYTVRVTVDPLNRIPEDDEANNTTTAPIVIGAPPPTCTVYPATDVPIAIPDQTTISSTLSGPPGTVDSVRIVGLAGTHTYMSDLQFTLQSPDGTDVVVIDQICGQAADFALDLADSATHAVPCPPEDGFLYLPGSPLSVLQGENAGGPWTLQVEDIGNLDIGSLDAWGLEICTQCGNGTLDAGETCDDGNTEDGDCCSADCQVATPDGTPCSQAPQCLVGGACSSGTCQGAQVSCHPCLTCDPPNGCVPPTDALCKGTQPNYSRFTVRKHPTNANRDSISWTWKGGAPVALSDFGSPDTLSDMTLCVYDNAGLKISSTIPAGQTCDGEGCWRMRKSGWCYDDPDRSNDGVGRATLKPGDANSASIKFAGRGTNLGLGPLDINSHITVRLKRDDGTPCWESHFHTPEDVTATRYKAKLTP